MANSNVGVPPVQAFAAQSTIQTAGVLDGGDAHAYHSLIVLANTGVTAGTVVLELSNDGVNWFGPASNSVSTTSAITFGVTVTFPAQFARARISVAPTGGTLSAWVASA